MTKQRWRESLKSFIGNHIDPEKDEELKGTKEEVEGKVQKILKLLKSEDEKDVEEPVAVLIEDFYKQYQHLCGRYEHLTGQLREKVNGKKRTGDSSSSSDSDDSPRKKEVKNGRKDTTEIIKRELETANSVVSELRSKLAASFEEKEAMKLESQSTLTKIQEAEMIINDLNAEVEMWKAQNSELLAASAELNLKVEGSNKLEVELDQKVNEMTTEISNMISEKETALGRLEQGNTALEELRTTISQLKDEKDALLLQLEVAKGESTSFQEQLRSGENEVVKLRKLLKSTEEENESLSSKIVQLWDEISNAKDKIEDLDAESTQLRDKLDEKKREHLADVEMHEAHKSDGQRIVEENEGLRVQVNNLANQLESVNQQKKELDEGFVNKNDEINLLREEKEAMLDKISELEKAIIEKGDELSALQKKLEDAEKESSTIIVGFTEQVDTLRQQVDSLMAEKNQLEVRIDRTSQESSESLAQAEIHRSDLANKIMEQDRKIKEQADALSTLGEENKRTGRCIKHNLEIAERKLEEMKMEVRKDSDAKNEKIDELEETIEELRRELEMKADDMSTLVENVRNIEVKDRLLSQKLRVTEQLLNEKDEDFKIKEEKLIKEKKVLGQQIASLGHIVTVYKEAQHRLVTDITDAANCTFNGMDTFSMKFEEDYGHMESRIHEILNDVKAATEWIKEANGEKERLVSEVQTLVQQLESEKELELGLKDKVGRLEMSLLKEESELKSMMKNVKQLENVVKENNGKIEELETKMKEKDLGMLDLSEEKREAIRQLCIWIDYHRTRYDDLREIVSKTPGARRQIAT